MVAFQGGHPSFKGDSPYSRPQPSRAESSPTRSEVLPYGAGAGPHASCKPAQGGRSQTAARGACNRPAVTGVPPLLPRPAGERAGSHAGGMQPRQVGAPLRLPARPAWRPRPTHHATGTTDAACEQLHRHPRHCRASSTAEPVQRLEATLRMTQRRQPGATVNAAKNGPVVMVVADGQEQRSRRQPGLRPIRGQRENPLSRREDNALVFRSSNGSRTRNAPRTARLVALTSRRDGRRLWQEKQATLRLRHNDRVKRGTPCHSISYPFPFSSFSLLQQGPGKGDTPKRILLCEGTRLRASLLIKGSKAGPSKGSTAASEHVGSTPTTGQRFEGWPLGRVQRPPQATRAPRPLLIRGSKAGPRKVHSRLKHRARDDHGYVRYITKAWAVLPRYPRTFPRPAGTIL
jgi:hypothetical protein